MDKAQVVEWFGYRDGTPEEVKKCVAVRTAAVAFAVACAENIENPADRTYTLRKVKDALQAAIGGIVAPIPR